MPNSLELNVSPALLHTFANHPFHVRKDMEMNELVDSIRESGVIVPLIVRTRPEGGYEIISGHRRCEACRELGIEKVPVRVQELTDDEATILMVNSNIQREHVLPSEKAFAYKMKMDAMKHQGRATSGQVVPKLDDRRTGSQIGSSSGESYKTVQRYIRLTHLIFPILQMVDESRMAFNPAVEISYMTPEHQRWLAHAWVLGILPASQLNATVRAAFMPDFTLELLPIFSSQKRVEMSILSGFLHSLQWFGPQKLPRYFQA